MNFKEMINRITGISTPIFGVSWNPPESERAVARQVMTVLEDRRVLFDIAEMELPEYCIESVIEMREELTEALVGGPEKGPLNESLRAMRSACRKFLNDMHGHSVSRINEYDYPAMHWEFIEALGQMRGVFGVHIAKIAVSYNIDIESQLQQILPADTSEEDS